MAKRSAIQRDNVCDLPGEKWKDVPGHVGVYQVSNKGRVKRVPTTVMEITQSGEVISTRSTEEYILQPTARKDCGYLRVGLTRGGKVRVADVHRLVAQAFCPKLPEEIEVHHIDRDRLNNEAINLIWLTPEDHSRVHRRKHHSWRGAAV